MRTLKYDFRFPRSDSHTLNWVEFQCDFALMHSLLSTAGMHISENMYEPYRNTFFSHWNYPVSWYDAECKNWDFFFSYRQKKYHSLDNVLSISRGLLADTQSKIYLRSVLWRIIHDEVDILRNRRQSKFIFKAQCVLNIHYLLRHSDDSRRIKSSQRWLFHIM